MLKDNKKVWLDTLLGVLAITLGFALFFVFAIIFLAAINRALDIEEKGQHAIIEQHKSWLRDVRIKD